jgi:hypothetical protein
MNEETNIPMSMTLRDYFAAKAMVAAYPKLYQMFMEDVFDCWIEEGLVELAKEAYETADAMMQVRELYEKRRNKEQPQTSLQEQESA